ncbi:Small RNA degrading nuclease [Actinidia chinensis var. chinensis]|uniref:Small RNA degrading nuclease n=1 Tax=Actinidia chinensis var. chinensis TaxID=1590841 RepID=A0A2R6PAB9_ACTCC|nr:Small RNA degrading nuclease [Actinidia chinensis var. chinensis]
MDEKIASARKEVLVELVKMAQKRGMKGSKGTWKEFLSVFDKKFGSSLSDPTRRSTDALAAFLNTFSQKDDLKFFDKVMRCHSNRDAVEQFKEKSEEVESPEQRLVRLTLEHPQYPFDYSFPSLEERLVRLTLEHPQYPFDYSFPSLEEGWLVTKLSKKLKTMRSTALIAIDCEMVLCEDGTEALVNVCVVDRNLKVKLNELVNPNKAVADYRSEITGLTAKHLDGVTCSVADIQKSMKKLLSHGAILVGHSLNNDLQVLKLDHARVIDTSLIFKYENGASFRRPSLNNLCKAVLGYEVRKNGAPHNCLDDACAAMKLVLAKIEGCDNAIPLVHEDVPEIERSKLLLHGIPTNVPSEELHKIVPGDFAIEIKPNIKTRREKYSAFAIFKNQQEANLAFENINENQDKDTSGRPQKCISFQLDSGMTGSLYVRKMARDDVIGQVSSMKRSFQDEEATGESKKLKVEQAVGEQNKGGSDLCDGHLEEIERLKQELKQRDQEISSLNKIIVALARKQGL